MKRLYEGVSVTSVIFFLIIVVGGFIFGTKTHKNKSRHTRKVEEKVEKKVEKANREKDKYHQDQMSDTAEELEYLRKMHNPLWNYFDEETNRFKPIPGKYNVDVPRRPRQDHVR